MRELVNEYFEVIVEILVMSLFVLILLHVMSDFLSFSV